MLTPKRKFAWIVGVLAFALPLLVQALVALGTGRTRVFGEPLRLGQLVITAMPIVATELAEAVLAPHPKIALSITVMGSLLVAMGAGLTVLLLALNVYEPHRMDGLSGAALLTVQLVYASVAYICAQELYVARQP